ncbi:MAG: metallophosphoesterase [Sandaracinaceae bacterium]|jgi:predicted phosphodiesterase|nr:metallophosphoesterase [Sandaracinaceae bacterium]
MAFCSDVQGNLAALEAVLADVARRAITDIYVAGNVVLGGDKPLETWMRLATLQAHITQGPKDLAVATVDPDLLKPKDAREKALAAQFKSTRDSLGEFVLQKLKRLPVQIRMPLIQGDELVVMHGSPSDPSIEFSHDLDDDETLALVADDPADIIVCGGALVPFERTVPGVRIVNVGVVHNAENRVAHYTIITPKLDGTIVEQAWAEY